MYGITDGAGSASVGGGDPSSASTDPMAAILAQMQQMNATMQNMQSQMGAMASENMRLQQEVNDLRSRSMGAHPQVVPQQINMPAEVDALQEGQAYMRGTRKALHLRNPSNNGP